MNQFIYAIQKLYQIYFVDYIQMQEREIFSIVQCVAVMDDADQQLSFVRDVMVVGIIVMNKIVMCVVSVSIKLKHNIFRKSNLKIIFNCFFLGCPAPTD